MLQLGDPQANRRRTMKGSSAAQAARRISEAGYHRFGPAQPHSRAGNPRLRRAAVRQIAAGNAAPGMGLNLSCIAAPLLFPLIDAVAAFGVLAGAF